MQSNIASNAIDANLLLQKIIIPLKKYTINFEFLSDKKNRYIGGKTTHYIIPPLIEVFNEALILIERSRPDLLDKSHILNQYRNILFWDCDKNLRGSCDFIKFYSAVDSLNITRIVKLMHDREKDDKERERLLLAAFDMKNSRLDASLRFMLLERIANSMKLESSGKLSTEQIRRDANLFSNILKIDYENFEKSADYTSLIKALNPWELSRNVDDTKNSSMTELIRLASSKLLYAKNGALSKEMKDSINNIKMKLGNNYEQGIEFQLKNLVGTWSEDIKSFKKHSTCLENQTINKHLVCKNNLATEKFDLMKSSEQYSGVEIFGKESHRIKEFLLKDVKFNESDYDEYLYLIYQLNYGHFSLNDAEAFWNNTKRDQTRILDIIEDIIKLQLANTIVYTNTLMNRFYNENKSSGIIDLLKESDREASRIRKAWIKLISRSYHLIKFLKRVYTYNNDDNEKQFEQLSLTTDALKKNIKYLVTYPNMFPLIHVMAKKDLNDEVIFWGRAFTITNETIIKMFFSGSFPPWFDFGNDSLELDSTQIVYAYYYTLITQVFETYSVNEVIKFSVEDFFTVIIKQMVLVADNYLKGVNKIFTEESNAFQTNWKPLLRDCKEELEKQPIDKANLEKLLLSKVDFNWEKDFIKTLSPRSNIQNEFSFTDLDNSIFKYTTSGSDSIGEYLTSQNHSQFYLALKKIRTEAYSITSTEFEVPPYTLEYARILLKIYQFVYPESKDKVQKIFDNQMSNFEFNRARYLKSIHDLTNDIDGCHIAFVNRSRDIRHAMIFREAEELGKIYDKMHATFGARIQAGTLSPEDANLTTLENVRKELTEDYTQTSFYPAKYRTASGWTRLNANSISFYPMDYYAKVKYYLEDMFKDQYDIDPAGNFATEPVYDTKNPKTINFDWDNTNTKNARQTFITNGIREFASLMNWASNYPNIEAVKAKMTLLVELFKLNTYSIKKGVYCDQLEDTDSDYKKYCKSYSAKRLINYYKNYVNLLNIDSRDEVILNYLGLETKYNVSYYHQTIKHYNEHQLYAPYDLLFKRILSDQAVGAADSFWFQGILEKYVSSVGVLKGSTFIFPYKDEVDQIFKNNYGRWFHSYFDSSQRLLQELDEQKTVAISVRPYKYRTIGAPQLTIGGEKSGDYAPFLSPIIYNKFKAVRADIIKSAGGEFDQIINKRIEEIDQIKSGKKPTGGK